jgi:hypothetical protein
MFSQRIHLDHVLASFAQLLRGPLTGIKKADANARMPGTSGVSSPGLKIFRDGLMECWFRDKHSGALRILSVLAFGEAFVGPQSF